MIPSPAPDRVNNGQALTSVACTVARAARSASDGVTECRQGSDTMTTTSTRPAHQVFSLETIGRVAYDGAGWVLYSDDVHRHVVRDVDYDRPCESAGSLKDYDAWCESAEFADDETAIAVCQALGEPGCHSATDGACGWLDA